MRARRGPAVASRLGFVLAAIAIGGAGCSYSPTFKSGVTKCATSGQACPSGYTCDVGLGVCVSGTVDGGSAGGHGGTTGAAGGGGTTGTGGGAGTTGTAGAGGGAGTSGTGGAGGGAGTTGSGGAGRGGTGGGAAGTTGSAGRGGTGGAGGGCGDIVMSAANCGACGHSCGAGQCSGGVCQPFVVQGITASSISVDTANMYFTQGKKVLRCAKTGCGGLTPYQIDDMGSTGYDTWSVNVTNGTVFFMSAPTQAGTEHDDLFYCPLAGCPSPAPILASARYLVTYLWNIGNDVYYSDTDLKQTYRRVCQPNGGTCEAAATAIVPAGVGQRLLAASANEFYFVDTLGLQKCAYAGCPGTTATATGATLLLGPQGAGLVPTLVFYFNGLIYMQFGDANHTLSGAIKTCTPTDCDNHVAKTIIQGRNPPVGLTVDAQGEYWIEDNTLYMCTANGCLGGAKTLATGVTRLFNTALSTRPIVTDDAFIYWLNDDAGVVKAIAK